MNKDVTSFASRSKTGIILVSVLLLIVLLFQVVSLLGWRAPNLANSTSPILGYLTSFYATLMYLVLAVLIGLEAKNLKEFNIDRFALATFILGSFIRRRFGLPGEESFLILIGLAGAIVIATFVVKKPSVPRTNIKWVLVGILISAVLLILIFLLELLLREAWAVMPLFRGNLSATVISEIVKELSFGALIEEILIRGFLWGYLRREGWDEKKISWAQGLLFWFLHVSRVVTPFSFFIVIPLITILFTKLTMHTKQVYPAIVSHIVINVLSSMLNLSTF